MVPDAADILIACSASLRQILKKSLLFQYVGSIIDSLVRYTSRISTSVVRRLPKPDRRVRLPYPALLKPALAAGFVFMSHVLGYDFRYNIGK